VMGDVRGPSTGLRQWGRYCEGERLAGGGGGRQVKSGLEDAIAAPQAGAPGVEDQETGDPEDRAEVLPPGKDDQNHAEGGYSGGGNGGSLERTERSREHARQERAEDEGSHETENYAEQQTDDRASKQVRKPHNNARLRHISIETYRLCPAHPADSSEGTTERAKEGTKAFALAEELASRSRQRIRY
jgi:hypothetical protein